jgi:hypothetical protein
MDDKIVINLLISLYEMIIPHNYKVFSKLLLMKKDL